jgi:lysophospholipase L1-like esterase
MEAVEAPREAPRRRWAKRFALLGFALLLLLVLDFAAARLYRLAAGHPWPAADPERVYRIPNGEYHHDLRPNFSTDAARWGGSYPVRTNSLGFRDALVRDVPLESKGRRILVLGDSFTEGVGVPFEQTFPGRVAASLAPGTEILNAAVMSYAPCIYYRKVKHLIEERRLGFSELVVAVDVGDVEDEATVYELEDDVVRVRGLKDRVQELIKTNSIIVFTILDYAMREPLGHLQKPEPIDLSKPDAEIEAALRRRAGTGVRRSRWPHDERVWKAFGEEGVRLMTAHMDQLLNVVNAKGIPLTVVVYPWPDQIVQGDPDCRAVSVWREWCEARGVRFVDSFPKFEVGAPWRRRAEILESCYIPGDVHLSAEGHRRVAEAILEAVPKG